MLIRRSVASRTRFPRAVRRCPIRSFTTFAMILLFQRKHKNHFLIAFSDAVIESMKAWRENKRSAYFSSGAAALGMST